MNNIVQELELFVKVLKEGAKNYFLKGFFALLLASKESVSGRFVE